MLRESVFVTSLSLVVLFSSAVAAILTPNDAILVNGSLANRSLSASGDQVLILIEGSCSSVNETDLVLHETVNLWGWPLITREKKISWHGDKNITCLTVFGTQDTAHPGTVTVTDGGVAHYYITLDLKSDWGHGLHMVVYVYGK